jgi:cytochrome P450
VTAAAVNASALRPSDGGPDIDLNDLAFQTDPWPLYARFRRDEPVHRAPNGSWYVFRYDDVRRALLSPEFSVEQPFRTTRRAFGPSMVDRDGDVHQRLRRLASQPVRPRSVDECQSRVIEPVVDALLDELEERERFDVVGDLAVKVPMRVFCDVMGLPAADAGWLYAQMRPLIDHVDQGDVSVADVVAARAQLREYFRRVLATGRHGPGGLLHLLASVDDDLIGEADVLNNAVMLLAAGTETTSLAIGNLVACLVRFPWTYDELRRDPDLVPAVVRECLRFEPPLHFVLRVPVRDIEVADVVIPEGSPVQLCLGSANREEGRFTEPDEWRLRRPEGPPLTFGMGRHGCVGMGLAHRELEVVLRALLSRDRAPTSVDGWVPPVTGRSFRGVRCFAIRLDPRGRP